MLEETLEVGPFTPQEIEEVCEKLKSQGVVFEMIVDEATEQSEMKNDYDNVAEKLGWRTKSFIGQIFYLKMKQVDFDRNKEMLSAYGMATTPIENPKELDADLTEVHNEAVNHEELKRLSARSILAVFLILIFCIFVITWRIQHGSDF
jgi:hypothetical protein